MNKKGFTLVELLAVIVILGIIASVSVVALIRNFKNSKQKLGYENAEQIVEASEAYFVEKGGDCVTIAVLESDQYQYLDKKLSNPRTGDLNWEGNEKENTRVCKIPDSEIQNGYKVQNDIQYDGNTYSGYKFDGFVYIMDNTVMGSTQSGN